MESKNGRGIHRRWGTYLKRVIVTPAVYPRLVEFLHFDIQSTVGRAEVGEIGGDRMLVLVL